MSNHLDLKLLYDKDFTFIILSAKWIYGNTPVPTE